MAQIIPFPADAEESSLESLSREELLALAQELREKLAALDAREPEDMMSKAYERWGARHEALEAELDGSAGRAIAPGLPFCNFSGGLHTFHCFIKAELIGTLKRACGGLPQARCLFYGWVQPLSLSKKLLRLGWPSSPTEDSSCLSSSFCSRVSLVGVSTTTVTNWSPRVL